MADLLNLQYQMILDISRQMQQAGEAQEWDLLLELEKQRQDKFAALPNNVAGKGNSGAIVEILKEIQECDRALMEKVESWLQHARILLRMPPKDDNSP